MINKIKNFFTREVAILLLLEISVFVLGVSTILSYNMPIYPDEFAERTTHSRWMEDGRTVSIITPQCLTAQEVNIPWSWIPNRFLDQLFYGSADTFSGLRIRGMAIFALFCILLMVYLRQISHQMGFKPLIVVFSLIFSGLTPIILTMARYESVLLIHILGLIILSRATSIRNDLRILMFLVLASSLFALHPKAIVLTPLVLLLGWHLRTSAPMRPIVKILLAGLVLGFALESYVHYKAFLACPESPHVQYLLKIKALDFGLIKTDPAAFMVQVIGNIMNMGKYYQHISFQESHYVNWFPPTPGAGSTCLNCLLALGLIALAVFALTAPLAAFDLSENKKSFIKQAQWQEAMVFSLLMLGLLILNQSKEFYDAAFMIPLAMLCFLEGMQHLPARWQKNMLTLLIVFFLPAVVWTQAKSWDIYYEGLKHSFPSSGIQHNLIDQETFHQQILEVAAACGIPDPSKASRLVVDDTTYFALKDAKNPIFVSYIFWGSTPGDYMLEQSLEVMHNLKSDGVVTHCNSIREPWFSKDLQKETIKSAQNICCLSKKIIDQAFLDFVIWPNVRKYNLAKSENRKLEPSELEYYQRVVRPVWLDLHRANKKAKHIDTKK